MKKFLRIRNIIIVLIVLVAVAIILCMKKENIETSKVYKFLTEEFEIKNNIVVTMQDKEGKVKETYAKGNYEMDGGNYYDIEYVDRFYSKDIVEKLLKNHKTKVQTEKGIEEMDVGNYAKDISHTYIDISGWNEDEAKQVNHKSIWLIKDKKIFSEEKLGEDLSVKQTDFGVFSKLKKAIYNSKSYISGHEFVQGKFLYYESFKNDEIGQVKIYFEDEKMKYIKIENLDILEIAIEEKEISKSLLKIPADYKDMDKYYENAYNEDYEKNSKEFMVEGFMQNMPF